MSGNAPKLSERILNEAGAISVELILHRLQDFRALGRRALNHVIHVGKIYIEAHRARADAGRADVSRPHVGIFVGQHDVRIADLQFGVAYLAVRAVHANRLSCSENIFVVLNGSCSALDDQVRRN